MDLSIVVPVYRGENLIEPLVSELTKTLPSFVNEYEIILVNDGSPDNSWGVIRRLIQEYKNVKGIDLMRNYGQYSATLCGACAARYEVIVTMDQDLQHRPKDIPVLLEKLEEGYDVIYGAPKKLPQGWIRNFLTATTKQFLASIIGVPSIKHISAFRAFRTRLRAAFGNSENTSLTIDVLLSWGTTRFATVQVDIAEAHASNYNFASLARVALLIMTGYSTKPLRLASWIGFFMTLFGIGIFVYVVVIYFVAGSLPGFPFLASIIALFNGVQMFTLGVFGEYLARMFERSMNRPAYVVSEMSEDRTG